MDLNVVEFPDGAAPPAVVVQATGAAVIGSGREIDFLTANYRPGYGYEAFPSGSARRLKGGRQRYFQITMHYEPNGTAVQDRSSFGFWFASAAPATEIVKAPITAGVITADGKPVFDGASTKVGPTLATKVYYPMVPANTSRFEVVSVQPVTAPLTIYELLPHAHNRASDFKCTDRVSRWTRAGAADGATLRRDLAVRLPAHDAGAGTGRREDRRGRALQQLVEQQDGQVARRAGRRHVHAGDAVFGRGDRLASRNRFNRSRSQRCPPDSCHQGTQRPPRPPSNSTQARKSRRARRPRRLETTAASRRRARDRSRPAR